MAAVVPAFLLLLVAAGAVLLWEARTGRLSGGTPGRGTGPLYFAAAVAGAALLVRLVGSGMPAALALVPITAFSLARCVALVRRRRGGWAPVALVALALLAGVGLSLLLVPEHLDQAALVRQIFDGGESARSIDPGARFSVRS